MHFTDIHCHLLPGIDDGAEDWQETLRMAKMAVDDGIGTIICTPHQLGSYTHRKGSEIRGLVAQTQQVLNDHRIPLRLLSGADVRIDEDMLFRLRSGDCVSLADHRKHVLLELPHELYLPVEPVLNQLRSLGMVGILSHPERNQGILRQPEVIVPLVSSGCLMQVTADSIVGTFGAPSQKFAEWMLTRGLVHFIATDAHGSRRRKPIMSDAYRRVTELVGSEVADALCYVNPAAVAEGREVPRLPKMRSSKGSWWSRLLSRSAA